MKYGVLLLMSVSVYGAEELSTIETPSMLSRLRGVFFSPHEIGHEYDDGREDVKQKSNAINPMLFGDCSEYEQMSRKVRLKAKDKPKPKQNKE